MKVVAEFTPRHLEKALDLARHIATFATIDFKAHAINIRIVDPAKVAYMDLWLYPDMYKCDQEFMFGVNLGMLYKLFRSLDNNTPVEIEADESFLKINQICHHHTLAAFTCPYTIPEIEGVIGPSVDVSSKLLQKYIRSLSHISSSVDMNYDAVSDSLHLESTNSIYRTLFSIDTSDCPNPSGEYSGRFLLKFMEMAINPGLADKIRLHFGHALRLNYSPPNLMVDVTIAPHTDG
jgi:DNA polymerase III sliding clamp (beta) subunit (PCNA family)